MTDIMTSAGVVGLGALLSKEGQTQSYNDLMKKRKSLIEKKVNKNIKAKTSGETWKMLANLHFLK